MGRTGTLSHAGLRCSLASGTLQGPCTASGCLESAPYRSEGILDFDHYGGGTDHIIARHGIDWIAHYSAGRYYSYLEDAAPFLSEIEQRIEAMQGCDVILYQAGADPHVDDPLGGWLTMEQLFEGDRRVFQAAHALGVPIAWNLAGGYQTPLRKVLDIHDNTMRACAAEYL